MFQADTDSQARAEEELIVAYNVTFNVMDALMQVCASVGSTSLHRMKPSVMMVTAYAGDDEFCNTGRFSRSDATS